MKRTFAVLSVLALIFLTGIYTVSCAGAPPPAPVEEPAPPPPPPPPPPPAPEPEPVAEPEPPAPPPEPEPDTKGPELNVNLSPQYFSPDADGVDDVLTVSINCVDESPIKDWKIEIREPEPPYLLFSEWSGQGGGSVNVIAWDGRSSSGELVQSATDYPFTLTVADIHGNSSTFEGKIGVDILVIREGDTLRVQVPSIVFGSYSGGFTGLDEAVLGRNDYILRRIAQVLNKFNTYQIKVEGHANTTAATESARRREQEQELQPLSEQRAQFVVDYLVNLGVNRGRMTAFGIGGARPVATFEDRNNWWKNRRVEFILVK